MDATIIQSHFHGLNYTNNGFDPFEFVLAALAACTTATVKMYADRKGWEIKKLNIQLSMVEKEKIQHIQKNLTVEGDLTEEQIRRLIIVADKCPVHKILTTPNLITTRLTRI